jgi:hypothetical protein
MGAGRLGRPLGLRHSCYKWPLVGSDETAVLDPRLPVAPAARGWPSVASRVVRTWGLPTNLLREFEARACEMD